MAKKEIDCGLDCPNPDCDGEASNEDINIGAFDLVEGNQWKIDCHCMKCKLYFTAWYKMKYDVTSYEEGDIGE